MRTYFVRRLLYAALTFGGITVATFTLIHSVPGDPVSFYVGRAGTRGVPEATLDAIRRDFHLDRPLTEQYIHWLKSAGAFDFGESIVHRRSVRQVIVEKLPNTFVLNLIAFTVAVVLGVPAGVWSAARSGRVAERISSAGFFLLYSLPTFWVALLLIQLLSVRLGVLPLFGMQSDGYFELSWMGKAVDRLRHLALPVLTLAYAQVAIVARFSKAAVVEVIRQDFIIAARARGVGSAAVLWRHALRNALIPLVTLFGLSIPYLLSGSVIVEQIFQWDGVGLLYLEAILARDYPVVMGLTVVTAAVTLVASVLADVLYAAADPRIRLEGGSR